MNCRNARDRTVARQDGPLSAAEETDLQAHLMGCNRCAMQARDLEALQQWLHDLPVSEPSPNFEWRLRLRISKLGEAEPVVLPAPTRLARRWPLQFAGSAAVAAIAVLLVGIPFLRPKEATLPASRAFQSPGANASGLTVAPVAERVPIGPQPVIRPHSLFIGDNRGEFGSVPDSSATATGAESTGR